MIQSVVCDGCHETFLVAPGTGEEPPASTPPTDPGVAAAPLALTGGRVALVFDAARDRLLDFTDAGRDRLASLADGLGSGGGIRDRLPGAPALPDLPEIPRSRLWAWASVPLALLGVIVGLSLIQNDSTPPATASANAENGGGSGSTRFINQPGYSLALPAGWEKANPPDGAVFAAEAPDGNADATLWIDKDPGLSLKQFEARSISQLEDIAENVRVADRVSAPTIEGSIVELKADTPVAGGVFAPYRVTLRGAGPFRHYLATALRPGADPQLGADIELIHSSLRPEVELEGLPSGAG